MIKSMTGFGRGEAAGPNYKVTVEMKSVNHRYLDLTMKLPKKLNVYEANLKNVIKKYIVRGKVDVYVTYENVSEAKVDIQYNSEVAAKYLEIFKEMAEEFHIENDVRVSSLSRYPEVLVTENLEPEEDELFSVTEEAFVKACEQILAARQNEGSHLREDLVEKLDGMLSLIDYINSHSEGILKDYRAKLLERVQEVLGDVTIDENRIATEVVLYADKICVDEEMVRLKSHINSMKNALIAGDEEGIGRKLDFIAQEMNREANTTLSKANNLEISQKAIDLKTEIEKVREQIQNIE
ncbi:MAG: YicC family protein [Thermoflexaceae bacterium]|nr:YicC family protein [Thermoflexaceae bacterium]